jgi:hypothetical protein
MSEAYHFISSDSKILMFARLVFKGDHYGRNGCLTHEDDKPLIEFYDGRFDFDAWTGFVGQFIGRWYLETFMDHEGGMCLDGGIPNWQIGADNTAEIQAWVRGMMEEVPYETNYPMRGEQA